MEDLQVGELQAALSTKWLGRHCLMLPEVDSTNDLLKEMIRQGGDGRPPAGFVLLTDFQKRGRGRLARRWEAPPKSSLLLSLLFHPDWPAERMNWLTMLVSLAAAEAIETQTELAVGIKWPNDLMVRQSGSWHKVSGLLLEGDFSADGRLLWAVVGIGINVNIPGGELPEAATPAASLLTAAGRHVPRLPLLADFLNRVEKYYEQAANGRSPQPGWEEKLITLGQPVLVTFTETGRSLNGRAESIDDAGHLVVLDDDGRQHTIAAADVTLREI